MRKGARAIILGNGKMLLGKRLKADSFYGQWRTFGGLSKTGEAAEATLRRELHEELGISVFRPQIYRSRRMQTSREKREVTAAFLRGQTLER